MISTYYKTKASVEEYIKLAEGINGSALIEKLVQFLPVKSRLLEIGSGPGSDWEILKTYYEVIGSDNSTEFLSHLKRKFSNGEFLLIDAITLETDQKFDGIYSNKVMHHLKDSELNESIKKQHERLNSGGIICHSFWKGEGSEIFKGLFVNYHTKKSLKTHFQKDFEILFIDSYKEFDEDDSLLLIAKKK